VLSRINKSHFLVESLLELVDELQAEVFDLDCTVTI